jgi:ABC-type sugar transport system ATPase subunit
VLDVSLHDISFRYPKDGFELRDVTLSFPRSTCTTLIGPAASGLTTLLKIIRGDVRPESGEVRIGARVVNTLRPDRRPLLFVTSDPDISKRWSVQHALIAAVRTRTLDRVDRLREYDLAAEKWDLSDLLARRVDTLSSSQSLRVHLARIELLRPGILLADRLLDRCNPSELLRIADALYRTLRVMGTTVIAVPAAMLELGFADRAVVLDRGRVVQEGSPAAIFSRPGTEAAARSSGDVNVIPISVRGGVVESVIGSWSVNPPPFEGNGVALARPGAFTIAAAGEESDLIFGIEEASFEERGWMLSGLLSGAVPLRILVPAEAKVHKGKLLPLRYDPQRFILISRHESVPPGFVPTNVVPPMRDSR